MSRTTYRGQPYPLLLLSSDPTCLLNPRRSLRLKHTLPLHLFRRLAQETITVPRTLVGQVDIVRQGLDFVVCQCAESAACQLISVRAIIKHSAYAQVEERGAEGETHLAAC